MQIGLQSAYSHPHRYVCIPTVNVEVKALLLYSIHHHMCIVRFHYVYPASTHIYTLLLIHTYTCAHACIHTIHIIASAHTILVFSQCTLVVPLAQFDTFTLYTPLTQFHIHTSPTQFHTSALHSTKCISQNYKIYSLYILCYYTLNIHYKMHSP